MNTSAILKNDPGEADRALERLSAFFLGLEEGRPATAKTLTDACRDSALLAATEPYALQSGVRQLADTLGDLLGRKRSPSAARAAALRQTLEPLKKQLHACAEAQRQPSPSDESEKTPDAPPNVCCHFHCGGSGYFIAIEDMEGISQVPEITPLPLAPGHIPGLIHSRGRIIPLIDLSRVEKTTASERCALSQLVIARAGKEQLAFMCDSMPELIPCFKGSRIDPLDFCVRHAVAAKG